MAERAKVLFLCVGNACRSQMAEAIARSTAADVIEPFSAGLVAFGQIAPMTESVLKEHGMSAEGQSSKGLRPEHVAAADLIVNMSGRSSASIFPGATVTIEDWDVGDPYGFDVAIYRGIRDEIETRIGELAQRLRKSGEAQQSTRKS